MQKREFKVIVADGWESHVAFAICRLDERRGFELDCASDGRYLVFDSLHEAKEYLRGHSLSSPGEVVPILLSLPSPQAVLTPNGPQSVVFSAEGWKAK